MGAAVFFQCDNRPLFVLENLSVSHPPKNGTKPNLQLGRPHTLSG